MPKKKKKKDLDDRIDEVVKDQRKKAKSFWGDFKKFISKGNVIDLATAVVIGTAFNKIVNGLVNFILTPLISLMIDGIDMTSWKYIIREEVLDDAGEVVVSELSLQYGAWLQTVIDFLVVALFIFLALRFILRAKEKFNEKEKAKRAEADRIKKEEADRIAAEEKAEADRIAAEAKAEAERAAEEERRIREKFLYESEEQVALLRDIKDLLGNMNNRE